MACQIPSSPLSGHRPERRGTAKAVGLVVSPSKLVRADKVIE
jgi:hypothetical protein